MCTNGDLGREVLRHDSDCVHAQGDCGRNLPLKRPQGKVYFLDRKPGARRVMEETEAEEWLSDQ
jgi:hypothetical protein